MPIWFPLFLIIIIIGSTTFFIKQSTKGKKSGKRIYWVFGTYLTVLLISTVIYAFFPKQDQYNQGNIEQKNTINLAELVYKGKSLEEAHLYIKDQWEFDYDHHELQLKGEYDNYDHMNILINIDRKEENDGKIEVTYYETPNILEGVHISEYTDPVNVNLANSILYVQEMNHVDLHFNVYRNEFPIRQFFDEKWWIERQGYHYQVLNVSIPKNVKITDVDEAFEVYEVQ